jgi:hypothetical protein
MAVRDRLREAGLDRWVEAVVASTDADVEDDRLQAGNVTVLPSTSLRPFIVNRRIRLSAAEVDRTESAIQGLRGMSR